MLVNICTEQKQCFQALFQAQQDDQQVLWSLIASTDTPAAVPAVAADFSHISLTKVGPHDDPQTFLELFE